MKVKIERLKPKPVQPGGWHDPELLEAANRVKQLLIQDGDFAYAEALGDAIEKRATERQLKKLARMSVRTY